MPPQAAPERDRDVSLGRIETTLNLMADDLRAVSHKIDHLTGIVNSLSSRVETLATGMHNERVGVVERLTQVREAIERVDRKGSIMTDPNIIPAGPQADRIVIAVTGLMRALDAAEPEQKLYAVMLSCEDLIRAYFCIAALNRDFALVTNDRDRELAGPAHGTA
jgi:hypothetical protein